MGKASDSHIIGYFDLSKNKKKDPESKADYLRMASSCFDSADSFLRFASYPFLYANISDAFSPAAFANSSFACELFLKTLLLAQCCPTKDIRGHYLDELFGLLDEPVRESILASFPMGDGSHTRDREEFFLQLKEVRNAFSILRYSYELSGYAFQYEFVLNLMISLREEARRLLELEGYEKSEVIVRGPSWLDTEAK